MIPLIIVRPEPGASSTLAAARAVGLDAYAHPIFAVRPVEWQPVARETVDAVALGSANALRHGGAGLERLRGLPAYCVGETTARAARAAGLLVVRTGSGGLQQVIDTLAPDHRRILRLAGTTRTTLTPPAGVTIETREVYASVPLPIAPALEKRLTSPAVVLLHSGEAASHFEAICTAASVNRSQISLVTIGPRVTRLLSEGWHRIETAPQPSDAALLALAQEMCKDAGGAPQPPR